MADPSIRHITARRPLPPLSRRTQWISYICLLLPLLFVRTATAQTHPAQPISISSLPDAPQPQIMYVNPGQSPCRVIPGSQIAGATLVASTAAVSLHAAGIALVQPETPSPRSEALPSLGAASDLPPCPSQGVDPFARFISGPTAPPLSPKQKARLAARNVIDPFNAVTILATAGISVGADSHSPYGPGMEGFAKNVGVAYTQDMTGQFFDVFLIPSLVHQDPRYYRMPHAAIPRRVLNAITQVYWSRSDTGQGMLNYATFVGFAINAEIMNLYVPGIQTDRSATATRYVTGLASAPIDNFITEFLPDVASHIHVRIVLVQRVINQVARTEPVGTP